MDEWWVPVNVHALRVGGFMCDVCFVIICSSPASILYKSIAGRYRPVSYPDGPIMARYRFIKNAYWVIPPSFGALLRVASGPRVKLTTCKSALNPSPPPPPVLVLLLLPCGLIYESICFMSCVIFFLCFSVLLALRLPRLGKREPVLVLFVRLFYLRLFGFVCFLFLLVSGKGCGL